MRRYAPISVVDLRVLQVVCGAPVVGLGGQVVDGVAASVVIAVVYVAGVERCFRVLS